MSASALAVLVLLNNLQKYGNETTNIAGRNNDYGDPTLSVCFSRLVTGRRLIDRYIRRTFPCDSLARCQLACSVEREFICEGFNYRFGTGPDISTSCQLTAMPGMNLDLTLDFISDVDYDFYSRDRNAPPACGYLSYKTWNYAGYGPPPPQVTPVVPEEWWLRPTAPPTLAPGEYGVGLQPRVDLNEIYNNRWNNHGYECFIRAGTGFRLNRQVIVMTLNAPTLYDCEFVCANERKFKCNILSYRYSSTPMTDNCQLGEKTIRQLEYYYDLAPDRDYDVYVRNELSQPSCQPTRTWDSDCFERTRSGVRIDQSLVRFAVNTDTLIDCELICLHIRHFTCRAFSFRYGPKLATGTYNCLLTDHPVPEMDPRKHFIDDGSCELYHRGSYGHGCEIDRWPYGGSTPFTPVNRKQWPSTTLQPPPATPSIFTVPSNSFPYSPGRPTTTPMPYDPGLFFPSTGRPYLPPDPGYSSGPKFRPQKPVLPASPTLPPKERPQVPWSSGGAFGTRKLDKICYIAYGAPARLKPSAVAKSLLVVGEQECKAECSRAREVTKFRCATISYWSGHCELSDIELRDLKAGSDFTNHDSYWLFSWDFTNPRCYSNPVMQPPADGVWSSFTVSGTRCKWGTQCSYWSQAGVWSCPVEGGDWDYCCRPDHHCGFSEGYPYPWCYVGAAKEQWRPCNDKYYPYQEHKRGAPHWPISYVHKHGPPNSTANFDHQPSIVDNFLASLQFDKNRPLNGGTKTATRSASYGHSNSSALPEFQVVDITENVGNLSAPTSTQGPTWRNVSSLQIIPPGETYDLKRHVAREKLRNKV